MKPNGCKPNQIQQRNNWIGKGVDHVSETVSGTMSANDTKEFCKHHVIPEILQVQQQTNKDNKPQHKHVLRGPLYLTRSHRRGNGVTIVTTSRTILHCQDKCKNNVNHY